MSFRLLTAAWAVLFTVAFAGCEGERTRAVESIVSPFPIGQAFNLRETGTILGEVVWQGPVPTVPPLEFRPKPESPKTDCHHFPNPNEPVVDGDSQGVANAVVFLRSVDLSRCRPWDHAGVFVELSAKCMRLEQGNESVRAAFARRGERLTLKSVDETLYVAHAGGAAFFSLTFAEPNKPRQRLLPKNGIVELSSAVGHFWQRGYVFVDDHPYYTRTDTRGRFMLDRVPSGDYQVVCWLPNWKKRDHERDTETSLIRFIHFGPALELEQAVNVLPTSKATLRFILNEKMFLP
jgi:hypothetical protein